MLPVLIVQIQYLINSERNNLSKLRVGYGMTKEIYFFEFKNTKFVFLEIIKAIDVRSDLDGVSFKPFDERSMSLLIPINWFNDLIGCFSYDGRYYVMESTLETVGKITYI